MDTSSRPYYNPPETVLWTRNAVANGTAAYYQTGPHTGTLSIKTMVRGKGVWSTPEDRFSVDSNAYLVVNNGQSYSLEVSSSTKVETFAVFFRPGFIEEVRTARFLAHDRVLEGSVPAAVGFYERLNPKSHTIARELRRLHHSVQCWDCEEGELEDRFVSLGVALLDEQFVAQSEQERLDHVRRSVRDEVFRRLSRARDCLLASSQEKLDLAAVAHEACLSPFYFHRLFTKAFGKTPHEYLTEARVRRAKSILETTDLPVWAVAHEAGFASVSHFCRQFKKLTGRQPTETRQFPQD